MRPEHHQEAMLSLLMMVCGPGVWDETGPRCMVAVLVAYLVANESENARKNS